MGAVKTSTMRCLYCRKKIPDGGRSHRKFCKAGCRTLAYRARKRGALQTPSSRVLSSSTKIAPGGGVGTGAADCGAEVRCLIDHFPHGRTSLKASPVPWTATPRPAASAS